MYSLLEYSKPKDSDKLELFLNEESRNKLLLTLSQLKISWIFLDFNLTDEHYSFICDALHLLSVLNYIYYLKLKVKNLSSALGILDLLYNWANIEYIDLYYLFSDEISNPEEVIYESKKSFINKYGVLSKLNELIRLNYKNQ